MTHVCKVCTGKFRDSPDSLILCKHHDGMVHLGCCINDCSEHKAPCDHCSGVYDKLME